MGEGENSRFSMLLESFLQRAEELYPLLLAFTQDVAVLKARREDQVRLCAEHQDELSKLRESIGKVYERLEATEKENALLRARVDLISKLVWTATSAVTVLLINKAFELIIGR